MMSALEATFDLIARAAPADRDDWWIIGSAAMVLAGVPDVAPDDVDVLASRGTAHAFAAGWDAIAIDGRESDRFRSEPYLRTFIPGCLTIEVMAGLEVRTGETWTPVRPGSRIELRRGGRALFIPALDDQVAMLRLFGRDKDLAKAAAIERFVASSRL